jgi:hypothetical protein
MTANSMRVFRYDCGRSRETFDFPHGHNSSHTRPQIPMNFRRIWLVFCKCSNILTSSCPCARYRQPSHSIVLSYPFLACGIEALVLAVAILKIILMLKLRKLLNNFL